MRGFTISGVHGNQRAGQQPGPPQWEFAMQDVEAIFDRYEAVRPRLPAAATPARSIDISSLLEIATEIDCFVFDAFGVLNVGDTLIDGADVRVDQLRARGCQIRILTNAASYDRAQVIDKFKRLGVRVEDNEIVTSRDAAMQSLPRLHWGVITAVSDTLGDLAMPHSRLADDPESYRSVDGFLFLSSAGWNERRQALLAETMDAHPRPLVIANADLVAPRDDGFSLEPGYFGHLIADRHPGFLRFFGKPFPEVYRLVEETLPGVAASRIAMCGDTLHTDILGASAQGWRTVLVTYDGLFAGSDTVAFSHRSGLFADWRLNRI
jgi:HAD superfamily hydrolase (TIGR01450 family)